MRIEEILKSNLGVKSVQATGYGGGGCISEGQAFILDGNEKVFVKINKRAKVTFIFMYVTARMAFQPSKPERFFRIF